MTHDELVSKLKEQYNYWSNLVYYTKPEFYENTVDQRNGWSALRAVLELHKPCRCNYDCCDVCVHCFELEGERADIYPCPTIQAIEKELE
jgi:hypothetical protein